MEQIIKEYIDKSTWKIKENSNAGFSLSGLKSHVANHVLKAEQLNNSPAGEYHKSGSLHIHDLSGGSYSGYCYGSDLMSLLLNGIVNPTAGSSEAAKHFDVIVDHIVNYIYISQNEWEGAQAFSNFDTLLAPFVRYDNLTQDQVKQNLQRMVYNLSYPLRAAFQSPFSNLSFDLKCPDHMKNEPVIIGGDPMEETFGEFQHEMDMINIGFLDVMLEGDRDGRPHTFPIPSYSITKDFNWDCEVTDKLFELTAKFGLPYFMSYIGSGLDPSSQRAMCCLSGDTKIISKGSRGVSYKNITRFRENETPKVLINGEFKDAIWLKTTCDYMYNIKFVNGIEIRTSPDHPCVTQRGIIESENITTDDWMPFSLLGYDGKDGSYDLGRFIGLYLAEGSKSGDNGVVFSFNENERKYIDFVSNFASMYYGATSSEAFSDNGIGTNIRCINTAINSKTVHDLIEEYIGGNLAINKYLKSKVFKMSKEFRQGLLDGEYQGDGSTQHRMCTASKQLSEDLACLISSVGSVAGITVDNRTKEDGKLSDNPLYLVRPYSLNRSKYKNIFKIDESGDKIWIKVKEIHKNNLKNNEKYVYDFEMQTDDHLFQLANGLITHNCRLQMDLNEIIDMSKGGWWNTGVSTGSLGVVSINMPQLGYLISKKQHEDLKPFYDRLDELIDVAKQHLIYKRKMVEYGFEIGLMPFTREYLKDFSHFFSTIGIIGMNECCLNLFGKPIYECVSFTENVLSHISNRCREFTTETGYPWNFEETPAEGACYSLALKDKKMYPDIITQGEDDSVYYSNSSHIPVGDGLELADSVNIQAKFKHHYSGGTLFHIWAGEAGPSPGGVKDLIRNMCNNTTLPYIAYTKAYAICAQCGITDDLSGICPKCSGITDVYSRVTGFYRPVRNYNPGKMAEFNDRKMFKL